VSDDYGSQESAPAEVTNLVAVEEDEEPTLLANLIIVTSPYLFPGPPLERPWKRRDSRRRMRLRRNRPAS
jgi:hypothetical protein